MCRDRRLKSGLAATVILLGALATPGYGDVLFGNLGPNGTYDTSNPNSLSTLETGTDSTTFAAPFQVSGTGEFRFSSAELPLQLLSGSGITELVLMSNAKSGGHDVPGTVLDTMTVAVSTNPGGGLATTSSSVHPILDAGNTYWLGLQNTSAGGFNNDYTVGWFSPSASSPTIQMATGVNNKNWAFMSATAPAFEIDGTPVATVPEPSSAALFLVSAGGALVRWRRRGRVAPRPVRV
jgi:hypothetical protein